MCKFKNCKKPKLLAPVGGVEQLKAAINFGADEVYLATKEFGMRAKADNFTMEQLMSAVKYAHDRNVEVYVACNVLMHDSDIDKLKCYFEQLAEISVDGVIVSDMGACVVAKKQAPNVAIHISTQASVANVEAVLAWAKMGAKRIVLAREMSLEQISHLRNKLDELGYSEYIFDDAKDKFVKNPVGIELEAFVHGAMCMSVSGRCLISSYLASRSANKGLCVQPCRWGYNVEEPYDVLKLSLQEKNRPGQEFEMSEDNFGTYILNSKDLNMLKFIDKIAAAGISSLKIEGRNKKSLYVVTVVNSYRHVIDAVGTPNYEQAVQYWSEELNNVSHRPYSTGFYFGPAQQSPDYDGYQQNCVHVADVLNCEQITKDTGETLFEITLLCRNRFDNNQELEALIPKKDPLKFIVKNLRWKKTTNGPLQKVDVANRAKNIYKIIIDVPILAGSIIRNRKFLRTCG